MPKSNMREQRGYSLVEILVAIAVFATIIVGALLIYDRSNRDFKQGVEQSNLQQNTRVAFDKLVSELRMTGFDFDRDGIPTGSVSGTNQYQQPDEQFEYIAPGAVVIRANLDYETETAPCAFSASPAVNQNCDNGREGSNPTTPYESTYFPVVTTGNDEIVAYGLVPQAWEASLPACDPAANCIRFFADTKLPRRAYPDVAAGGLDENVVEIPGVDLCIGGCNNPPYTLYRFNLARDRASFTGGANVNRTPIATNIRSLNFTYFQDTEGREGLRNLNNDVTPDLSSGSTVLGLGQFRVSSPVALVTERALRAKVNAIGVRLIGMNERREAGYAAPGETLAAAREFRQYRLETLVVPRNIQKRGMKEQDTTAPGSPTITSICTGRCGGVYLQWSAPPVSSVYGAPDQYKIIYDVSSAPGFTCETTTFTNTFGYVFGGDGSCPPLIPNQEYKFRVVALNSYGSGTSDERRATPRNNTRPNPVKLDTATITLNGKVTLTWTRPTDDASGSVTCGPAEPPAAEIEGYRVYRRLRGAATWNLLADETVVTSYANTVTWTDTTAINCIDYEYTVLLVERCEQTGAWNVSGNPADGISVYPSAPAFLAGKATSTVAPGPPSDLVINQASPCILGVCSVEMNWPKVTADADGTLIAVTDYNIYRKPYGAPATSWARVGSVVADPTSSAPITWTNTGVDTTGGKRYEYRVAATQCGLEGAPGPVRPYPCAFPPGVVGTPALQSPGAFDGNGTAAEPFLVATDATIRLNAIDPSRVLSVRFDVYEGATIRRTATVTSAPFQIAWTPGAGVTNRVDAAITETSGCITTAAAYVRDEPSTCCIVPGASATPAAPVVSYAAGNNFVDITLRNFCGEVLDIQSIDIVWSSASTPGGTKADIVRFPASPSGTVDYSVPGGAGTSFNVVPPVLAADVPTGSAAYTVRVVFSKTLTSASSPITTFTVNYRRPVVDLSTVTCPVLP